MTMHRVGKAVASAIKQFFLFWYRFTIGEDAVGAGVAIAGLVGAYLLSRTQVPAFWLLPLVVMASVIVSLALKVRDAAHSED